MPIGHTLETPPFGLSHGSRTMSELRQQMIDAVLVRGFSPWPLKSYPAAIPKTVIIEGVSATEMLRL